MSEATIHGGIAYLAGQVPETPDAGIEVQTAEVLAAIDDLLAQAGSDKTRILRAQVCDPSSLLLQNRHSAVRAEAAQAHREKWSASENPPEE